MTNEASTTETTAAVAAGVIPAPTKDEPAKPATKKVSTKASKPAAKKDVKPASKKTTNTKDGAAREGSKKAIVLDLLRRKDGATMAEIAKATDWQNHSIRGFISGNVTKKMGIKVESTKNESGERVYRIASK